MFAVGHASITNPPDDPHPVTPLVSEVGVKLKVLEVVTPVIVTVVALDEQELADIAVVPTVVVTLEGPTGEFPIVATFQFVPS